MAEMTNTARGRAITTALARAVALAVALAVVLTVLLTGADGGGSLAKYRIRRMSNAPVMASPPFAPADDAPDCELFPGVPEILGDDFDPGRFDEIDLAGNGRLVAYASAVTPTSIGSRAIVVLKEGAEAEVIAAAAGDDDQPAIAFDPFGWRMVFRGSDGVAGESPSNVYLHTVTRYTVTRSGGEGDDGGDDTSGPPVPSPTGETRNLTALDTSAGLFARDASLAARARTREFRSGVTLRERDARVAFVSNGDLDKGRLGRNAEVDGKNPENLEQVFLWRERDRRFVQLTRNDDPAATMARTTMTGNGRLVAFESDADLTPDAPNPRDPTEIGNPLGVRQIFLWRGTRSGGRLEQLTWSEEDCLAPRITHDGRFVFFCSRGDLLPGGNPEGNFEIFRWRRGASAARRLAQLTQTASGHSVLPRPLRSARRFVFYSTASPPVGQLPFGAATAQCAPTALLWTRGNVRLVFGLLDSENAALTLRGANPVLTGPPAAAYPSKIHFATNDALLDPPRPEGEASLLRYHLARATRFAR